MLKPTLLYYWTIQVLQNCARHLKTLRNSLNKDIGLLEGRGGQHTSPGFLALSQSPIEERTGQKRGRPGEWKEKKAPLAPSLKQEKPTGVMLAVWENVLLLDARAEVHEYVHKWTHARNFIHSTEVAAHILQRQNVEFTDTSLKTNMCVHVWFWYSKLLNQTSKKFISFLCGRMQLWLSHCETETRIKA